MTAIEVRTSPPYRVTVGRGVLSSAAASVRETASVAILSDGNVAPHYAADFSRDGGIPTLVVPPGEGAKSFAGLEEVLDFLVASDFDRTSVLVALGGGVVGDLGGLAASMFMRGIDVVQCPTSLLAMVDASVGGKTAVNLRAGKNLAGTFHQPRAVFADPDTLATLPATEYASGLGEVVKTALIGDAELLTLLEEQAPSILARDPDLLTDVVERCVRLKAGIVERDEREGGERKLLNLGHTFAHGIEQAAGFGTVPHGVAVAVGLGLAVEASARLEILDDPGLGGRLAALLGQLGVSATLADLRRETGRPLPAAELRAAMRHDKKGVAGAPTFVLPRAVGALVRDVAVEARLLDELLG